MIIQLGYIYAQIIQYIHMGNFFKSLFSSETGNPTLAQAKKEQKDFDVFKYDGLRAMRIGQVRYAIKCYREALKIREDKEVLQFLATACASLHAMDEALEATERLVELEPENMEIRLMRAGLFFQMEREQDVIKECRHVIERDDSQPAIWFMMGRAKRNLKDLNGAIADLTRAIALKEDFPEACLLRGETFLEANRPGEALVDARKLIALSPEEEAAYLLRGRIYEYLGDASAAAADYERVGVLNPFNGEAALLKGALLLKEGRVEEAVEFFNEVLELIPSFPEAYRSRARAKSAQCDPEGAREDEKRAEALEEDRKEEDSGGKPTDFNDMYKGGIF
jgi:tetratricopeptide (TPR) repeat protein